ncbi:MAG TPA: hypothetical protein V6C58_27735, partial [Allocoleopsis sp.]
MAEKVTPTGKPLDNVQKMGLELVSIGQGRDVVLALDRTESVGFNDEGLMRLRQIVQKTIQPGDTVYLVPFADQVNPCYGQKTDQPCSNLFPKEGLKGFKIVNFKGQESIDDIVGYVKEWPNQNLKNTDIQLAELRIYQGLAQLNQDRLYENQSIKPQSVVWVTDAPLDTTPPANSQEWIETPGNSPMRDIKSPETQERTLWLQNFKLNKRSLKIKTNDGANNSKEYQLYVVDIPPTVQEFCTPAPGGRETCLVNGYLTGQLWLRGLFSGITILIVLFLVRYYFQLKKKWKLKVKLPDDTMENLYLNNNQKI